MISKDEKSHIMKAAHAYAKAHKNQLGGDYVVYLAMGLENVHAMFQFFVLIGKREEIAKYADKINAFVLKSPVKELPNLDDIATKTAAFLKKSEVTPSAPETDVKEKILLLVTQVSLKLDKRIKFNDWEQSFIKSLSDRLECYGCSGLTVKQLATVDKLYLQLRY